MLSEFTLLHCLGKKKEKGKVNQLDVGNKKDHHNNSGEKITNVSIHSFISIR